MHLCSKLCKIFSRIEKCMIFKNRIADVIICETLASNIINRPYSVSHIITYPSKELCSKMALGEVGVSLP